MSTPSRQAFIGSGANLGDRAAALAGAVGRLRAAAGMHSVETSSVYVTAPVGLEDQPPFLNQVIGVETTRSPEALLGLLQEIEQAFGRERLVRWGPRTLDLDLLAYEGEERATPALALPHPRMFERDFVRVPLRELLQHERFSGAQWGWLRGRLGPPAPAPGVAPYAAAGARP